MACRILLPHPPATSYYGLLDLLATVCTVGSSSGSGVEQPPGAFLKRFIECSLVVPLLRQMQSPASKCGVAIGIVDV